MMNLSHKAFLAKDHTIPSIAQTTTTQSLTALEPGLNSHVQKCDRHTDNHTLTESI